MTCVSAVVGDPAAVRGMFLDIRRDLLNLHEGSEIGEHLARVIWELVTNVVAHAGVHDDDLVRVEIDISQVAVHLPGPNFDSVARANGPNARGLDTAAKRLDLVPGVGRIGMRAERTWCTWR